MDKKIIRLMVLMFTVFFSAAILIFPDAAAKGIGDGMRYSAEMLVPSLFPFMVISSFMIRSGASDILGKILSPVTEKVFRLPAGAGAAVVMSFAGGFPVGAKCVRLLLESGRINERQAERMMMFCVCSGPGFLVTGVGSLLLHSSLSGWILYLSQLGSGILIAVFMGISSSKNGNNTVQVSTDVWHGKKITDLFIDSCSDGADSVLLLTAMVTFFNMFISVCSRCGITGMCEKIFHLIGISYPFSESIFSLVFEVTGACRSIIMNGSPLWFVSFAVGFGGLCVHFQIFAILGGVKINKLRYFLFRIVNAFLSSVIVYIVCRFYCPAGTVFAVAGGGRAEAASISLSGSIALIIMCAVFAAAASESGGLKRRAGRGKSCIR